LVPTSRTITINGVSQDLSANRTYTIDALPSQTGNSGKYLTTNGTIASWGVIDLSAYVPYTGATGDVNLGTHRILAQNATIASSGSGDTFVLNHSSGSGIGLIITKGGNGEGLYINKTSGSGNAATIIGTLNATTLVKSGGTSSQFLKADGSVDSSTYVTSNIYTANGTLTSARTLTLGGFSLDFVGSSFTSRFTSAGRLLLGTTSEGTFLLDVNGTARVSGNTTISLNQNAATLLNISNTTSGNASQAAIGLTSDSTSGSAYFGKYSNTKTVYKIFNTNDFYFTNDSRGDIAILNDFATGKIKFSAGGSSTAQITLTSAGRLLVGTTTEDSYIVDGNGRGRFTGLMIGNTTTASESATLQADSITRGFLPPRMTTTQINAIATPAEGLQIYNTTISHMCFYQAGAWQKINHSPM
jgi:hypothetical protein